MEILLWPFIIVYRIIRFPFDLLKYFVLGIASILISFVKLFMPNKTKENKKQKIKKEKKSKANTEKLEIIKDKKTKKNLKEKTKDKKMEKVNKIDRRFSRIALDDKDVKGMMAKSYKQDAKYSMKSFKKKTSEWYNNLQFVKNAKNKKDINRKTLLIDFNSKDAERNEKKVHYKYLARNPEGRIVRGYFDAFSKLDVHSFLLSEGYEVYKITASKLANFLNLETDTSTRKMKTKDLLFFLTQLSTYLKAGVPLVDAVKTLSHQGKNAKKKKLFQSIIYELTMGESFSEALFKQGQVFPRLLTNMIKTAEMTGQLAETLDNMAEYYGAIEKNRKQVISAMMYPSIIFIMSILVVTFIMIYVIPRFVDIYDQADASIPQITLTVIDISVFLEKNILFVAIGVFLGILFLVLIYKYVKIVKAMFQWLLMHIPVMKNIIIYNEVTVFTKTFGALLNHNVLIMESMEILSRLTNNQIYKMLIMDTVANVGRGDLLSKSFKNHWAFPETAYQMIVTGERTGQLGPMMVKVADYYQEQQKNLVTQVKSLIEPIMISFIAVVVGGILLSVVLPMFNLYNELA